MAYVIAEPCLATCNAECVEVCPTHCIHGPVDLREISSIPTAERGARLGKIQLYIDPESCIDCGACVAQCPAEAIFHEDDLPAKWAHYRDLNAAFFARK